MIGAMKVTKTAFNEFVQLVQAEAASFGMEVTVVPVYDDTGTIRRAMLKVYWNGKWRELASETPFVGEQNDGRILPDEWEAIKAAAAYSLVKG